ncbi:DUF4255 domain-containing protein [Archaeoglobales archaeon]|nr:MAG: DUF4255 domain-containing protein [Archaeoglobales archaeon]
MSDYTAIYDVGETLIKLLWENIKDDPQVNSIVESEEQITLASPEEMEDGSKRLSLFLYHVTEFSYLKNQEMLIENSKLRFSPLYLTLHYLIIPYTQNRENDHILLGKVMQIFHDNAILRGSTLQGSLEDELRVTFNPLSIDELNKIWNMLNKPYRLSVSYKVAPVRIDSTREKEAKRVVERRLEKYVIG